MHVRHTTQHDYIGMHGITRTAVDVAAPNSTLPAGCYTDVVLRGSTVFELCFYRVMPVTMRGCKASASWLCYRYTTCSTTTCWILHVHLRSSDPQSFVSQNRQSKCWINVQTWLELRELMAGSKLVMPFSTAKYCCSNDVQRYM